MTLYELVNQLNKAVEEHLALQAFYYNSWPTGPDSITQINYQYPALFFIDSGNHSTGQNQVQYTVDIVIASRVVESKLSSDPTTFKGLSHVDSNILFIQTSAHQWFHEIISIVTSLPDDWGFTDYTVNNFINFNPTTQGLYFNYPVAGCSFNVTFTLSWRENCNLCLNPAGGISALRILQPEPLYGDYEDQEYKKLVIENDTYTVDIPYKVYGILPQGDYSSPEEAVQNSLVLAVVQGRTSVDTKVEIVDGKCTLTIAGSEDSNKLLITLISQLNRNAEDSILIQRRGVPDVPAIEFLLCAGDRQNIFLGLDTATPYTNSFWSAVDYINKRKIAWTTIDGKDVFVAIKYEVLGSGQHNVEVVHSNDAIHWHTVVFEQEGSMPVEVAAGNGVFLLCTEYSDYYRSTDGVLFERIVYPSTNIRIISVVFSEYRNEFVAGFQNTNENSRLYLNSSTDGIDWTDRGAPILRTVTNCDIHQFGTRFLYINVKGLSNLGSGNTETGTYQINIDNWGLQNHLRHISDLYFYFQSCAKIEVDGNVLIYAGHGMRICMFNETEGTYGFLTGDGRTVFTAVSKTRIMGFIILSEKIVSIGNYGSGDLLDYSKFESGIIRDSVRWRDKMLIMGKDSAIIFSDYEDPTTAYSVPITNFDTEYSMGGIVNYEPNVMVETEISELDVTKPYYIYGFINRDDHNFTSGDTFLDASSVLGVGAEYYTDIKFTRYAKSDDGIYVVSNEPVRPDTLKLFNSRYVLGFFTRY